MATEEASVSTPITSRRDFLRMRATPIALASAVATAARAASTDKSDEIIFMSATKLAGLIRARKVSAAEAVEAYINRIIDVNGKLNAIVTNSFARARADAKALDAKAARGEIGDLSALALQDRVGGDGGAEPEVADRGGVLDASETLQDAVGRIARRRQVLPDIDRAALAVIGDEIRERAADVDPHQVT